jgi:hypothetical protein
MFAFVFGVWKSERTAAKDHDIMFMEAPAPVVELVLVPCTSTQVLVAGLKALNRLNRLSLRLNGTSATGAGTPRSTTVSVLHSSSSTKFRC